MSGPLVSVVIPMYNKEPYINRTLSSVINQDYKWLELILIDDGSTDNGYAIVRNHLLSFPNRFHRVVVKKRENLGMTRTKNEGVEIASGEYVAFLDADDLWAQDKISKQVEFLRLNKHIDFVLCNYVVLTQKLLGTRCVSFTPLDVKVVSWLMLTGFGGLPESTGLVRRSSFINLGGFDPRMEMWAALDLTYRFLSLGRLGSVRDYLCGYRVLNDGWHNNKEDLVSSFQYLKENRDEYATFTHKLELNLKIYLDFWVLRQQRNFNSMSNFFRTFISNPIYSTYYLLSTLRRNIVAQIRTFMHYGEIQSLRKNF